MKIMRVLTCSNDAEFRLKIQKWVLYRSPGPLFMLLTYKHKRGCINEKKSVH